MCATKKEKTMINHTYCPHQTKKRVKSAFDDVFSVKSFIAFFSTLSFGHMYLWIQFVFEHLQQSAKIRFAGRSVAFVVRISISIFVRCPIFIWFHTSCNLAYWQREKNTPKLSIPSIHSVMQIIMHSARLPPIRYVVSKLLFIHSMHLAKQVAWVVWHFLYSLEFIESFFHASSFFFACRIRLLRTFSISVRDIAAMLHTNLNKITLRAKAMRVNRLCMDVVRHNDMPLDLFHYINLCKSVLIFHFYSICVHSTELQCIKMKCGDRKRIPMLCSTKIHDWYIYNAA